MIKELKELIMTSDMKEQNMTDSIVEHLKDCGYTFYYPAYQGSHAVDIAVVKDSIVYIFEVKQKGKSRHTVSTLIMQGVGQLLKYHFLIASKALSKNFSIDEAKEYSSTMKRIIHRKGQTRPMKEVKAFLVYCGFITEEDKTIIKGAIQRFNLPIELIVLELRD